MSDTAKDAPPAAAPLNDAEKSRLADLRGLNSGQLSDAERAEMDGLAQREGASGPDAPPREPLTDAEKARLAELRSRPQVFGPEQEELRQLTAREVPGSTLDRTSPAARGQRLSEQVNPPPPPAAGPQQMGAGETLIQHLIGVIEHLIGGMNHLAQTVPAAAALAPMLAAATTRLAAARAAFDEGRGASSEYRAGDYTAASEDRRRAERDVAAVNEGPRLQPSPAPAPAPAGPQPDHTVEPPPPR